MHPLEDYQLNGENEAGASNLILRAREIYVDQETSLLLTNNVHSSLCFSRLITKQNERTPILFIDKVELVKANDQAKQQAMYSTVFVNKL